MGTPYPSITSEQRQAITASGGLPIQLSDPATNKLYLLFEQPEGTPLDDGYIREALSHGIAALDAGERLTWNPERIEQEGRSRLDRKRPRE